MRKRWLQLLGVLAVLAVAGSVALYHFGPPTIRPGEERVIASLKLEGGDRVYVVAYKTGHWIDAYEMTLYHFKGEDSVVCFLGHEESYWWNCELQKESDVIKVMVLGEKTAEYAPSTGKCSARGYDWRESRSHRMSEVQVRLADPQLFSE